MNNVYCIIVTYNGCKWIDRCITCLEKSNCNLSIIVVDNCSNDQTLNIVAQHKQVVVISLEKNIGFGQANNRGIEYAIAHDATHVLLVNQDVYVENDTIEKLISSADSHSLISPIHLSGDGNSLDHNFMEKTLLDNDQTKSMFGTLLLKHNINEFYYVNYVNAACWLLPIEIIHRVGGFNPLFFQYGEDDNYIQRLHYHGFDIKIITTTQICHDRTIHGNENIYRQNLIMRTLLIIRTDINLTKHQRRKKETKILFQTIGKAIIEHNFYRTLSEVLKAKLQLRNKTKLIKQSILKEQEQNTTWLQIR